VAGSGGSSRIEGLGGELAEAAEIGEAPVVGDVGDRAWACGRSSRARSSHTWRRLMPPFAG
jgi:hypothetical protein